MKPRTILSTMLLLMPFLAFGWGAEGHRIVADIAQKKLNAGVEATVQKYLDTTTFEKAATWMDEQRSNHAYDYMKPWHYTNIERGDSYVINPKGDIVCELDSVIARLRNFKTRTHAQVNLDLKILFHLCGDITQPLHVGYGSDKGGNDVAVTYLTRSSNLHSVWDKEIIKSEGITVDACLQAANGWTTAAMETVVKIDPTAWMNDSRSLLPQVYDFHDGVISQDYIDKNGIIIKNQLEKGGLRLATILNEIFAGK